MATTKALPRDSMLSCVSLSSPPKATLDSRLEEIYVRVDFKKAPLSKVIASLRKQCKNEDPEGEDVRIQMAFPVIAKACLFQRNVR